MEWLALAGDTLAFLTAVLALITETRRRRTPRYTPHDENTGPAAAPEEPPPPLR
ncbi:hypothetical protein ACWCQQ_42870 [Streptomyces sp. NPDC002143]